MSLSNLWPFSSGYDLISREIPPQCFCYEKSSMETAVNKELSSGEGSLGQGEIRTLLQEAAQHRIIIFPLHGIRTTAVTAHPPLGQNAITSPMPADPAAGERVGRHGAIEPSG
jgi:hypothetical protein